MNDLNPSLSKCANQITESLARIQQTEGKVPQIEIDFLLDSIRKLYSDVLDLSGKNQLILPVPSQDHVQSKKNELETPAQEIVIEVGKTDADPKIKKEEKSTALGPEMDDKSVIQVSEADRHIHVSTEVLQEKKIEHVPEPEENSISEETSIAMPKQDTINDLSAKNNILFFEEIETEKEKIGNIEKEPSIFSMEEPISPADKQPAEEILENDIEIVSKSDIEEPITSTTEEKIVSQESSTEKKEELVSEDSIIETEPIHKEVFSERGTVSDVQTEPHQQNHNVVETATSTPTDKEATSSIDISNSNPKEIASSPEEQAYSVNSKKTQEHLHQASLFDYLKSSNVSKAVEQVDRFSGVKTLADKFLESKEKENVLFESRIEQEAVKQKIQDLRTAIGINDKFLFINELFSENMKAYNDFILSLSKLKEKEEALLYVKNVSEEYSWDNNSLAVKTFMKIFERKF